MSGAEAIGNANVSADGVYRYTLTRTWNNNSPRMVFIMLNPSTADALEDDPTIGRCKSFAEREGAGGIVVVNLYAYRTSKPEVLWDAKDGGVDVVGRENDTHIRAALETAARFGAVVVAAWGAQANATARADEVKEMAVEILGSGGMKSLHVTQGGHPGHPLYLAGDSPLLPYPPEGVEVDVADRIDMAAAWKAWCKDYGVSADEAVRLQEHKAFKAGWRARAVGAAGESVMT